MSKKNNQNRIILGQYANFLADFGYNEKEKFRSWADVLNAPRQKEVPIHEEQGEYPQHYKGKRNIVELYREYNEDHNDRYLLYTERQQIKERFIDAFGAPRTYRPDIVVFDRIGFSDKHPHYGIYIIEIDGRKNHTNKNEVRKGEIRDEFFFRFYNAVTVRIPTWRAHGRQRFYLEPQDLHDEMIYRANQLEIEQENLGNK